MADDSTSKTLSITLAVCVVCSILVSAAAVNLRGLQEENKKIDKIINILQAGQLYVDNSNVLALYNENIEPILVELSTGNQIDKSNFTQELNIDTFNIKTISSHPVLGESVQPTKDIARIKRKPKYMVVYLVKKHGKTDKIIFPIYGKGLWSTLYGFMALSSDLQTIEGLTFYDHGETPGLGGEIDNPSWKESWRGKSAFDASGKILISVIKGKVPRNQPETNYQIDGLSGATLTTRGVDQLIKFWLGGDGYGPFLKKMRARGINEKV